MKMTLIIRSKIREVVKRIDPQEEVSSIAADVGDTLELVVDDILRKARGDLPTRIRIYNRIEVTTHRT